MSDPGYISDVSTLPDTIADDPTYPAGSDPWSAQPNKVIPSLPYFVPGTTLPAEYLNYIHNVRDVYAGDLFVYLMGLKGWLGPGDFGPSRLRRYSTRTALKTETDHTFGYIALVDNVGMYQWTNVDLAEKVPFVVRATDTPTGAGVWRLLGVDYVDHVDSTSTATVSGIFPQGITGSQLDLGSLNAGDIISLDSMFGVAYVDASTTNGKACHQYSLNGGSYVNINPVAWNQQVPTLLQAMGLTNTLVAPTTGTYVVRLAVGPTGSSQSMTYDGYAIRARVTRS